MSRQARSPPLYLHTLGALNRGCTQWTKRADPVSGSTDVTITFANSNAAGSRWVPLAVCYQSTAPFTDLFGQTVTTGLLPVCPWPGSGRPIVALCVQSMTELPFEIGNVVENIVVPAGDPHVHWETLRPDRPPTVTGPVGSALAPGRTSLIRVPAG